MNTNEVTRNRTLPTIGRIYTAVVDLLTINETEYKAEDFPLWNALPEGVRIAYARQFFAIEDGTPFNLRDTTLMLKEFRSVYKGM